MHAWTPGYFRLFISHVSARKDAAGALRDGLWPHRVDTFVAHEDIAPTSAWQDEIEDALATCDACIAILSPGFNESPWCDQEIGVCFGRGILVLALHDGLAPYGFIGKFQAFNPSKYGTNAELCEAIFDVLRSNELSRTPVAAALVRRFEESSSYAQAARNVDLLKAIPSEAWTEELLDRAERAHEENRQISDANYRYGGPRVSTVVAQLVQSIRSA